MCGQTASVFIPIVCAEFISNPEATQAFSQGSLRARCKGGVPMRGPFGCGKVFPANSGGHPSPSLDLCAR